MFLARDRITACAPRGTIMKRIVLQRLSSSSLFRRQAAAAAVGNSSRTKSTVTKGDDASNTEETTTTTTTQYIVKRQPVVPYPLSPRRTVPAHIRKPPYADTGLVPLSDGGSILLHDEASIAAMRRAAQLARHNLELACRLAVPGRTTDEIDQAVHESIVAAKAYPSPLNYAGFPKSLCSSVNEIICHGIPDTRPLQFGDVVSFDVSCFIGNVHGDNCATVIVGDVGNADTRDWRGVRQRDTFATEQCRQHFVSARRLLHAAHETLYKAIATVKPGSCLSEIGAACQHTAEMYGYSSVTKYRGHGIATDFHIAPFVKHYVNDDVLELEPGMIFTIEPMICEFESDCFEWEHDQWTVSTTDLGLAAQFEHTVLVTDSGVEILTLPPKE